MHSHTSKKNSLSQKIQDYIIGLPAELDKKDVNILI